MEFSFFSGGQPNLTTYFPGWGRLKKSKKSFSLRLNLHADIISRNKVMPDLHLNRALAQKIFELLGQPEVNQPPSLSMLRYTSPPWRTTSPHRVDGNKLEDCPLSSVQWASLNTSAELAVGHLGVLWTLRHMHFICFMDWVFWGVKAVGLYSYIFYLLGNCYKV